MYTNVQKIAVGKFLMLTKAAFIFIKKHSIIVKYFYNLKQLLKYVLF